MFPQLHVVIQEIFHEILDHPLGLNSHAVALLRRALLQCSNDGNQQRDVLGLDQSGQQGEAARLLDEHSVLFGLTEGPEGVGPTSGNLHVQREISLRFIAGIIRLGHVHVQQVDHLGDPDVLPDYGPPLLVLGQLGQGLRGVELQVFVGISQNSDLGGRSFYHN